MVTGRSVAGEVPKRQYMSLAVLCSTLETPKDILAFQGQNSLRMMLVLHWATSTFDPKPGMRHLNGDHEKKRNSRICPSFIIYTYSSHQISEMILTDEDKVTLWYVA